MKHAVAMILLFGASLVSAQSGLNFRVVIPATIDVSKNHHPVIVKPFEPVQQRITVFSNLPRYCLNLKVSGFPVWQPKLLSANASLDGYKLCSTKIGTTEFVIEHKFGNVNEITWPVTIELVTL